MRTPTRIIPWTFGESSTVSIYDFDGLWIVNGILVRRNSDNRTCRHSVSWGMYEQGASCIRTVFAMQLDISLWELSSPYFFQVPEACEPSQELAWDRA